LELDILDASNGSTADADECSAADADERSAADANGLILTRRASIDNLLGKLPFRFLHVDLFDRN